MSALAQKFPLRFGDLTPAEHDRVRRTAPEQIASALRQLLRDIEQDPEEMLASARFRRDGDSYTMCPQFQVLLSYAPSEPTDGE